MRKKWTLVWIYHQKHHYQINLNFFIEHYSQKQWCHCNSPVFYYMWISSDEFWWHRWKIYKWQKHHNLLIFFRPTSFLIFFLFFLPKLHNLQNCHDSAVFLCMIITMKHSPPLLCQYRLYSIYPKSLTLALIWHSLTMTFTYCSWCYKFMNM